MSSAIKECPEEPKRIITPDTKIAALLKDYPELENVLFEMAPAFEKLKNPILRKTIAKVASLRQAAELGKIPLGSLINRLRQETGQNEWLAETESDSKTLKGVPAWVKPDKVVKTIDARPMLEAGEHPVNLVMKELGELSSGQLLELVTPFLPSPLIDMAKSKGFLAFSREETPDQFRIYFKEKD